MSPENAFLFLFWRIFGVRNEVTQRGPKYANTAAIWRRWFSRKTVEIKLYNTEALNPCVFRRYTQRNLATMRPLKKFKSNMCLFFDALQRNATVSKTGINLRARCNLYKALNDVCLPGRAERWTPQSPPAHRHRNRLTSVLKSASDADVLSSTLEPERLQLAHVSIF